MRYGIMNENEMLQLILSKFNGLENRFTGLETEINGMKQELTDFKADTNNNFNNLQGHINKLQEKQINMQGQINILQEHQSNMQGQIDTIANEVIKTRLILENTTNKNINLLVEGLVDTSQKLDNHENRIVKLEKMAI